MLLHLNHPGIPRSFSVLACDSMQSETTNLYSYHAGQFYNEQVAGLGVSGSVFVVNRKQVHIFFSSSLLGSYVTSSMIFYRVMTILKVTCDVKLSH
jgi:hypothetical protein